MGSAGTSGKPWKDPSRGGEISPFAWIRQLPSRRVGAIGDGFVSQILSAHGFTVSKPNSSEYDMVVNGLRLEVKFSTLWETNKYKFQQIRDQDYDGAMFLGISPDVAHMWYVPKAALMDAWERGQLLGQHGGQGARETAWCEIVPNEIPQWLAPYGPTQEQALAVLRAHLPVPRRPMPYSGTL